jgi:hypothetical protein
MLLGMTISPLLSLFKISYKTLPDMMMIRRSPPVLQVAGPQVTASTVGMSDPSLTSGGMIYAGGEVP